MFWSCMHQPILKGLLTRLGIHGPHIHFEGSHQGAASKQVLRMDNLPEQNHKQPVRLGGEKPLGLGVGVTKAGAGPIDDSVTSIFPSQVGRYLAGHRACLHQPLLPNTMPPPSTVVIWVSRFYVLQRIPAEGAKGGKYPFSATLWPAKDPGTGLLCYEQHIAGLCRGPA